MNQDGTLGSNPPECSQCGSQRGLQPCSRCKKPICGWHSFNKGTYTVHWDFCSAECFLEAKEASAKRLVLIINFAWAALIAFFIFGLYYCGKDAP